MAVQLRSSGSQTGVSSAGGTFSVQIGGATDVGRILTISLTWFDPDLVLPALSSLLLNATNPWTLLDSFDAGAGRGSRLYYYVPSAAETGIATFDVTFSDIATWGMIGASWNGVDLANPFAAVQRANATSTSPSLTQAASAQDVLWDNLGIVHTGVEATRTPTARNQTMIDKTMTYDAGNIFSVTASRVVPPGSGDGITSYTLSLSKAWRMQQVRIQHRQFGSAPSNFQVGKA